VHACCLWPKQAAGPLVSSLGGKRPGALFCSDLPRATKPMLLTSPIAQHCETQHQASPASGLRHRGVAVLCCASVVIILLHFREHEFLVVFHEELCAPLDVNEE